MKNIDKNIVTIFRWSGYDNRLLAILKDENVVGEQVSCYTDLNDDGSVKMAFHKVYEKEQRVCRFLSTKKVSIEYKKTIKNTNPYFSTDKKRKSMIVKAVFASISIRDSKTSIEQLRKHINEDG